MTIALAYVLGGPDIKAYFFEGAPIGIVCPKCNSCLDRSYYPLSMRVQEAARYDFGYTWDHQQLFSKTLIDLINESNENTLAVNEIPGSGGYFHAAVSKIITFDAQSRKTKFGPKCVSCGRFREVTGATPAFVTSNQISPNAVLETDLEFGGTVGKSPLLIIGPRLKQKIESFRLPGLYFKDVYCSNDSASLFPTP